MNVFRLLGYILLVVGLLSVCWKQTDARRIIYTTASEQSQRLPQQETFTRDEVHLAILNTSYSVWDSTSPWFIMPAVIMFTGGVLVDIGRRRRVHNQQPNKAPEPTPGGAGSSASRTTP
jgi:hypothetical protein